MTRLLAALALLAMAAVPALACPFTDASSGDSQPTATAAQPSPDTSQPPSAPADHAPS
jgi:hypothetical protein